MESTELKIKREISSYSNIDINFAIAINLILRIFNCKIGLFIFYMILLSIPMIYNFNRVMDHSLVYGGLFILLHTMVYKFSVRNTRELTKNLSEIDLELRIYRQLKNK